MEKKEITPALLTRTNKYHDEFAKFMMNFYVTNDAKAFDRQAFIDKHADKYPDLLNVKIHFRRAVRKYFDEHVYSLRNAAVKNLQKPNFCPDNWI